MRILKILIFFDYFCSDFRHAVVDFAKVEEYQQKTLKPSFKGAVFNYLSSILYINLLNRNNFTYNVLEESLITNEIVFYFSRNFYLVDEINSIISNMKSGGFIHYLRSKYLKNDFLGNISNLSLSFEQLNGVFQILMYGLMIASFSFVIEFSIQRLQKLFRVLNYK